MPSVYQQLLIILIILYYIVTESIPIRKKKIITTQNLQFCLPVSQNTNFTISAGNCNNYQYQIQVGVGTPPQYFLVQFDTGSDVLWIPTKQASSNGFNTSTSPTYQITDQQQSIQYADLSQVTGFVGSDYVTIPPIPLNCRQSVLFVFKQVDMQFSGGVLGVMGMGYVTAPNIFDLAYQAGQINTSTFALSLRGTPNQSYVYYNNIPSNITSNTFYSSVSNSISTNSRWQLQLVGFYAGSNDLTSYASTSVIIDSGTSLFYLNTNLFTQMQSQYLQGCTYKSNQNSYQCHCNNNVTWPNLIFMFPGVQIQIDSSAYVTTQAGTGYCYVQLNDLATLSDAILLGDVLFNQYIITFDKINGQIGFNGNTKVVPIEGGNSSFAVGEYVLFGFNIILLLAITFLIFYLGAQGQDNSMVKQQLNSGIGDNIYGSPNMEMSNKPTMQVNYI